MTNDQSMTNDLMTTYNNKKVVITGGLGFIGSNIAHQLVELGAEVVIVDALLAMYGGNTFNVEGIGDKIELVDGDVRDLEVMNEAVEGADYIIHLAGQVSYLDAKIKPFDDLDINGRGTLTVLEAMREFAPRGRILFSSSRLVYGKIMSLPVGEDHPTNPLSLYGIHKLLGEKYMNYYAHEFGLGAVSLRIPNPYGPRQQMKHSKYSIVGWFMRQAMEGATINIFGDGEQERDYLYIDDLVTAILLVLSRGQAGEAYNVGTRERVKFGEMVDAVIKAVGSGQKEQVPWPENYEKNETGDYAADTSKLTKLTDWQAAVSLEAGIKKMVDYYQKYQEHYW